MSIYNLNNYSNSLHMRITYQYSTYTNRIVRKQFLCTAKEVNWKKDNKIYMRFSKPILITLI